MKLPAQKALDRVKGSLVLDVDVERFLANEFERLPFAAPARSGIELSWRDFFAALPRCHEQGDLRYLDPKISSGGPPNEEVVAELEKLGGLTPEAFERYFHENQVTLAATRGGEHWKALGGAVRSMAELFDTGISVVVIATPARTAGTAIHYDDGDVLPIQFQGEKRWEVFEPQDQFPCNRTPRRKLRLAEGSLIAHQVYDLKPSDGLYVPRGWIHRVSNRGDEPSLHGSFVINANTWLSVFANLMDHAFATLRGCQRWRQVLTPADIGSPEALVEIDRFVEELRQQMRSGMVESGPASFDFVVNSPAGEELRALARQSIAEAESGPGVRVRRSGAHYLLRHSDNVGFVRVSGDGKRYYDVPSRFFYSVLRKDGISLADLEGASFSPQEIADGLHTLVYKTGAFRLESSDA
jgi:cupin superfamily protein